MARKRTNRLVLLLNAASRGDLDAVRRLADGGLLVDTVSDEQETALCRAAGRGHTAVMRFLIEGGADVNRQTSWGWSALMAAAFSAHADVIALLLEHGTDTTRVNNDDRTALRLALENQFARPHEATPEELAELEQRWAQTIQLLTAAHPQGEAIVAQWQADREAGERWWQRSFRRLYHLLTEYEGEQLYEDVLAPFVPHARETLGELARYRSLFVPREPEEGFVEGLWQWYALSRVNQFLLLGFQTGPDLDWEAPFQSEEYREHAEGNVCRRLRDWQGPSVAREEYLSFFETLGFRAFDRLPFSPFFHEIVEAVEDDTLEDQVLVEHAFWPGLMFGEMLFSRAGVRVRCNPAVFKKDVAERSRLHDTFWRRRRETNDLSRGWGHNSQWRTAFRRDYLHAGHFYYNVDGEYLVDETYWRQRRDREGDEDLDELSLEARRELLVYRCLVRTESANQDLWPYDDRIIIAVPPSLEFEVVSDEE